MLNPLSNKKRKFKVHIFFSKWETFLTNYLFLFFECFTSILLNSDFFFTFSRILYLLKIYINFYHWNSFLNFQYKQLHKNCSKYSYNYCRNINLWRFLRKKTEPWYSSKTQFIYIQTISNSNQVAWAVNLMQQYMQNRRNFVDLLVFNPDLSASTNIEFVWSITNFQLFIWTYIYSLFSCLRKVSFFFIILPEKQILFLKPHLRLLFVAPAKQSATYFNVTCYHNVCSSIHAPIAASKAKYANFFITATSCTLNIRNIFHMCDPIGPSSISAKSSSSILFHNPIFPFHSYNAFWDLFRPTKTFVIFIISYTMYKQCDLKRHAQSNKSVSISANSSSSPSSIPSCISSFPSSPSSSSSCSIAPSDCSRSFRYSCAAFLCLIIFCSCSIQYKKKQKWILNLLCTNVQETANDY